jgi:hypothetical protein
VADEPFSLPPTPPAPALTPATIDPIVAIEDQAPMPTSNTVRRKDGVREGLAQANAAKRSAMTLKVQRIRDRLNEYLTEDLSQGKWVYETKRRLCREFRINEETLLEILRKRIGIKGGVDGARRAKLGMNERTAPGEADKEQPAPPQDTPESVTTKWNIIDLFDRLAQHFDKVVVSDDDDDGPPEDARDWRSTWVAWRVFLAAAFGLALGYLLKEHSRDDLDPENTPLDDYCAYPGVDDANVPRGMAALPPNAEPLEIYQRCTGRSAWPEGIRSKIVSLIVGRRGGKSYITAIIGIYLAVCCTYRLKLGTKGMVMILARDKLQAGVIRGYIIAFLEVLPEIKAQFADDPTQALIEFTNGITIEVRAVGDAGTRGYTVVAALCDEIAFWPTDPDSAKQDKKVLRALRPAMWTVKNSMIVLLSSPYARRGELYENHKKGYGQEGQRRHFVWQADTLSMHPTDDPDLIVEIADEYEEDPDSAASEYGANFRSDLENIFSRPAVEAICVAGRIEVPKREGVTYRAFIDPSGGRQDSYVVAIAHDETRKIKGTDVVVPVLDLVWEEIPRPVFDPQLVSQTAIGICKRYGVSKVTGDAYAGEWPRDPFKKAGIEYELSDKNRSELYKEALVLVNSGQAELLDANHHLRMVNQFVNLERRVGRSGKDSIDHPPGGHDDVANAVAGVLVGKTSSQECTW